MTIEKIILPKGRIVGGHPIKAEKAINFKTKQPIIGKDGKEVMQYRVEYAIPKQAFLAEVWPKMQAEAISAYPNWQTLLDAQTGLPLPHSDFSWKMVDGDSPLCPKGSQIPYNTREGYPGHYVLSIKTVAFAPGTFVFRNGAYHTLQEHEVKVGDYLQANINIQVHTENDGGLYLNPNGFELVEVGNAIIINSGANPDSLFGAANTRPADSGFKGVLPQAGAPTISAPPAPPVAYPVAPPAPAAAPGYPPAPVGYPAAPVAAPPGLPAPAHDFVQNAGYPVPPAPAAAPGYPPAPVGYPVPGR